MVLSNSKRKKANRRKIANRTEVDILSNLHDSLLSHILSFLPTKKQAIATSILSKRWRYVWTLIDRHVFTNPYVYFDVTIDNQTAGRVVMELSNVSTSKTARNTNIAKPFNFKGLRFQSVEPGFMVCGFVGVNIYLYRFDHVVNQPHFSDMLSMVTVGLGTNDSKFLIFFNKTELFYGNRMVFGQVVAGMDVIKAIEKVGSSSGRTTKHVVADCGLL